MRAVFCMEGSNRLYEFQIVYPKRQIYLLLPVTI